MIEDISGGGLRHGAAAWLDQRIAWAMGSARVRGGLLRMAICRRENIPDLAVLALDQPWSGEPGPVEMFDAAVAAANDRWFPSSSPSPELEATDPAPAELDGADGDAQGLHRRPAGEKTTADREAEAE